MNYEQRLPYLTSFVYQLADFTYRTPEDILSTGLYFSDFVNNVSVKLEDGSTLKFNHAFFVEDEDSVGIFTEHCGYYIFHKESIDKIKQKSRSFGSKPVKEKKEKKINNKDKKKKAKEKDLLLPNIKIKKVKFKDK